MTTIAIRKYPCSETVRTSHCDSPAIWVDSNRFAAFNSQSALEAAGTNSPDATPAGDHALRALVCGIHKASRARWSGRDLFFIPIGDERVQPLLETAWTYSAKLVADNEAKHAATRARNLERHKERVDRDWADLAEEKPWQARYVERTDSGLMRPDRRPSIERLWAVEQVLPIDPDVDEATLAHFALYPDEYVSIKAGDDAPGIIEPMLIRINTRSPLSPKQARALAEALIEAAKVAEVANNGRLNEIWRKGNL